MLQLLNPLLDRWRLTALAASAGMLAIAHAFQTFGGLAPCTLCLRQREVYWVAATVALIGMVVTRLPDGERRRGLFNMALGLIFLIGAGVAVYHAGAEWKFWPGPTACASTGGGVGAEALAGLLSGATIKAPHCDEAPWVFLGLSMAGWNALISLGLAAMSLMAALRERSRP
jgi:disulfide bond formation protein DsbB